MCKHAFAQLMNKSVEIKYIIQANIFTLVKLEADSGANSEIFQKHNDCLILCSFYSFRLENKIHLDTVR